MHFVRPEQRIFVEIEIAMVVEASIKCAEDKVIPTHLRQVIEVSKVLIL